jgi:superfamily II DNA or RNA helicase
MELRPYQSEIVRKTIQSLEDNDLVAISAATGAGKSVIISELAKVYANEMKSVCILTNITALIPQLSRHLDELGISHNIIKAGMNRSQEDCNVHLIMEQSFHEDKRNELDLKCDVLIKDEYHIGVGQKRYESIVRHLEPSKTIGLSATLLDEAGYMLNSLEDAEIISDGDARTLTELGYLSPLRYFVPKWSEDIDYSNVGSSANDYNGKEIDEIVSSGIHIGKIIDSMNHMRAKEKYTLVYASSIDNAELINKALNENGYESYVKHSRTNENDEGNTDIALDDLKRLERPICIVSVSMLTIGFDYPKANLIVLCRPTKVKRLALQILGRGTRLHEGKEYCEVLDLAQIVSTHGFLTDPITYIGQGDKKALEQDKIKSKPNVKILLKSDEPVEVSHNAILMEMKEIQDKLIAQAKIKEAERLKRKMTEEENQRNRKMTMREMVQIFESSKDMEILTKLSVMIYEGATKLEVKAGTAEWIRDKWINVMMDNPEHYEKWIRAYKTRTKNIVQSCMRGEQKKISALYYFIDWLVERKDDVPYSSGYSYY